MRTEIILCDKGMMRISVNYLPSTHMCVFSLSQDLNINTKHEYAHSIRPSLLKCDMYSCVIQASTTI